MDHVTRLCSHAVIINEGTVVANGSIEELRASFSEASLGEIFLRLTVRPGISLSGFFPGSVYRVDHDR